MKYVIGGIIGAIIGWTFGAFTMALCATSGKASRAEETQYTVDQQYDSI